MISIYEKSAIPISFGKYLGCNIYSVHVLSGQDKNPALLQAYSLLRNVAESKPAVDTPESFSPDLYVLCAEIAFQVCH